MSSVLIFPNFLHLILCKSNLDDVAPMIAVKYRSKCWNLICEFGKWMIYVTHSLSLSLSVCFAVLSCHHQFSNGKTFPFNFNLNLIEFIWSTNSISIIYCDHGRENLFEPFTFIWNTILFLTCKGREENETKEKRNCWRRANKTFHLQ